MLTEQEVKVVINAFKNAKAKWVVIGAHAVGAMTQPRATTDYDFIVQGSKIRQVIKLLEQHFGRDLDVEHIDAGVRLRAIDIDIVSSSSHPIFQKTLDGSSKVEGWNIPSPEKLIVLKFMSAVSPWRGKRKRMQDVVDIQAVYTTFEPEELDMEEMKELASLVYPRAEKEFVRLLRKIDRGEPITL